MFDLRARRPANRPLVVGHRGAMGYAPENTMASYELAVSMGVDMVECDVHLSRDGVPVVIHDHTVDRTTDGAGLVGEMTLEELTRLDAGAWYAPERAGQRLPRLEDLVVWCRDRVALSIELKNGPVFYDGLAERVVELVQKHSALDRTTLISFDHLAIRHAKQLEPRISAGVLYAARLVDAAAAAHAAWADTILPNDGFATSDVIDQAHAAGLAISIWTVNEPARARELAALGVDAIATNYPDRILSALSG